MLLQLSTGQYYACVACRKGVIKINIYLENLQYETFEIVPNKLFLWLPTKPIILYCIHEVSVQFYTYKLVHIYSIRVLIYYTNVQRNEKLYDQHFDAYQSPNILIEMSGLQVYSILVNIPWFIPLVLPLSVETSLQRTWRDLLQLPIGAWTVAEPTIHVTV